jgi:hypothetical protein
MSAGGTLDFDEIAGAMIGEPGFKEGAHSVLLCCWFVLCPRSNAAPSAWNTPRAAARPLAAAADHRAAASDTNPATRAAATANRRSAEGRRGRSSAKVGTRTKRTL